MIRDLLRRLTRGAPAQPPAPQRAPASSPRPRAAPSSAPGHAPSPDQDRALELYKFDACPYCRRVQQAITRLGLSVPQRDTREEPGAREALIEVTGGTQVPALLIDGVPLLESGDIVRWLEAYATRARP